MSINCSNKLLDFRQL